MNREINTDITLEDFLAFCQHVGRQSDRRKARLIFWGCFACIGFLAAIFRNDAGAKSHLAVILITAVLSLLACLLYLKIAQRSMMPSAPGFILGPKVVTLTSEGLTQSSEQHCSSFKWSLVRSVGETPKHIFVMLDTNAGVIIPKSSFPSAAECASFLSELRSLAGAGR